MSSASALSLLHHGEICFVYLGNTRVEAIWDAALECWYYNKDDRLHAVTLDQVDEWMPAFVKY